MIPFLQDSLKVCLLSVETDLQMKAQANLTKIYKFGSVEISQENNEKAQKQSKRDISKLKSCKHLVFLLLLQNDVYKVFLC